MDLNAMSTPTSKQTAIPQQLPRRLHQLGYGIARMVLETERGLRSPATLRRYVPPFVYRDIVRRARDYTGPRQPITAADIRPPLIQRNNRTYHLVIAVRDTTDKWETMLMTIDATHRGNLNIRDLAHVTDQSRALPYRDTTTPAVDLVELGQALHAAKVARDTTIQQLEHAPDRVWDTLIDARDAWSERITELETTIENIHRATGRNVAGETTIAERPQVDEKPHLIQLLGPVPSNEIGQQLWNDAAAAVEHFRDHWDITDTNTLGPADGDPERQLHRIVVADIVNATREHLTTQRQTLTFQHAGTVAHEPPELGL